MIKALGLVSPVIVPLILSGILFFSAEKNNRAKLYLSGYMLLITFVFAANYIYFQHNYQIYTYIHSIHIGIVLAIYPGAYIYILLLFNPYIKIKRLLIHCIPSLTFTLASAAIFFPFLSQGERLYFLSIYRYSPDFAQTHMRLLYIIRMGNILALFLQVFIYSILFYTKLRTHRLEVNNIFSSPDKFQLNWLKTFNLLLTLGALVCVFLYTVNPSKLFGDDRFLAYPLLIVAAILWFLGIMGNNQKNVFLQQTESPRPPSVLPGRAIPSRPDLEKELHRYFKEQKPYLNPELKIWDVCTELCTNRSYISKLINTSEHLNFSAFVNSFRVNEACAIIRESPSSSLATVALEAGFGSTTSLSRAFSQQLHLSPTKFRQQCISEATKN